MTTVDIFWDVAIFVALDMLLFLIIFAKTDELYFNLKDNYDEWQNLNWFGVWFFTIFYWIAFLPVTIIFLIIKLFTVGRK